MSTLAETVRVMKDPALRQEFIQLPIERQAAIQEELLGKVITDQDFQAVMQTDRPQAVGILDDFRKTLPLQPDSYPKESKPWYEPRVTVEKLAGQTGQAALATGLAMSTVAGAPGFAAGAISSVLAEEGTKRLQEEFGPKIGLGLGLLLSALSGRGVGIMGEVQPSRAALATERGGKSATELKSEPQTPTEFPPSEPPKAYTRPPSGTLPQELGEQRVSLRTTTEVKDAVIENVQALTATESSEKGRRVMHQVVEALDKGMIDLDRVPQLLQRSGLTMREFADELLKTYSTAGKQLQQLSQVKKRLTAWADIHPDAATALQQLDEAIPDGTVWESIKTVYHAVDNPRRAAMVGQLATAVRNFFSQGGRYGVEIIDEALTRLYRGETPAKALEASLQFVHSLKPSSRAELDKILKEFPLQEEILKGNIVGELTIPQKFLRMLNTLNIAQEQFYRRSTFDAVLKNELRDAGMDVTTTLTNPSLIPEQAIEKATKEAMEVTFASSPKEKTFGAAMMQAYHAIPMLTTVNPYPRFWANAAEFLSTHNPAGVLKLLRKDAQGEFLSANPQRRAEILADATTGTMMLAGAIALQQAGTRGGKWYQIEAGDKQIDLRAYAPFSTYMFLADALDLAAETAGKVMDGKGLKQALVDSGRYTTNDVVQGVIGINRIAGTGLIFTDVFAQGSLDRKLDMLADFASQYIGSFTVPVRTLKDGVAAFSEEEAKLRDVRDNLLGPTKSNVPFVSQTLPEKPSPIEPTVPKTEHPALRQLSGLSVKTPNVVGREMDRLGIEFSTVRATTGNPELDRAIDAETGTLVTNTIKPFVESPGYQRIHDPAVKRFFLESALSYSRTLATQHVKQTNPELAKDAKIDAVPKRVRDLILSMTGFDLGKTK